MQRTAGPYSWVKRQAEYFPRKDWTAQIALIWLMNFVFARKAMPTA
ncbi:hypothetical protein [Bradyrhizobium sp. JR3.5]